MIQDPNKPADPQGNQPAPDDAATPGPQEVESLRNELDTMKDKYLRSLADCQNIQKRAVAERNEAVYRGQADMAKALFSVLDNFERTLEAAKSTKDCKALAEGVRIVYDQMVKVLGEFGLERMSLAKGDPFDPTYHQAIAQHATDEVDPEHILHIAQPGYTMRDRLLRPATVIVAKALPAPSSMESPETA